MPSLSSPTPPDAVAGEVESTRRLTIHSYKDGDRQTAAGALGDRLEARYRAAGPRLAVGVLPDEAAIVRGSRWSACCPSGGARRVGALLLEQHDERAVQSSRTGSPEMIARTGTDAGAAPADTTG